MELSDLKGLGSTRIERLRAMGIVSLRDLLYFFPLRFEDHVHITPLSDLQEGEYLIRGTIREKPSVSYFHGISRVSGAVWNDGQKLPLCWFNEPWMVHQIPVGREIMLYGRVQIRQGRKSMINPGIVSQPEWMPVYRQIKGIPGRSFRQMMREALTAAEEVCPETLPASFRRRHHLIGLEAALRQAHFPETPEQLQEARRRLDFENILIYLTGVSIFKRQKQPGQAMEIPQNEPDMFWDYIPFAPTGAQKRVLGEIAEDMRRDQAMSRLVQGDVGCGKTVLAFGAVWLAWRHGFQSAMMAPTEILARQHYENAVSLLSPLGICCRLLTGSTKAAEKRKIYKELETGTCHAVFGTHALISEGVRYAKLGLVITDEQHRFGVRQRSLLQQKGLSETDGRMPHVLVMSATPIPRSLALILYGDLDLSLVDELPPGRQPVKTRLVSEEKRTDMYGFLRRQIEAGRQAYVVCPLVEDSESMQDVKSAQTIYKELTDGELHGLRVGLTWGGQKNDDKEETLRKFREGELDVLVATTVIEVGVNVPNATVMVIENAERYGLSQLHQLRGRVGRGNAESWCFLLSSSGKKLKILCETNDGFEVAKKDLEIRGPGDLMGTRQSGDAVWRMMGDPRLLDEVQRSVRELEENPAFSEEKAGIESLAQKYFASSGEHIALN